jgi:pSer/pThr/pTyr-binding forkhead associated (FHA) protein
MCPVGSLSPECSRLPVGAPESNASLVVRLQFLSGKRIGGSVVARRFPFTVGRDPEACLPLDEAGVWERHIQVKLEAGKGFCLEARAGCPVGVNGNSVTQARLRNGDILELGAVKLRFMLSEMEQRSFAPREICTWLAMVSLCAAQVALLYWLLP